MSLVTELLAGLFALNVLVTVVLYIVRAGERLR